MKIPLKACWQAEDVSKVIGNEALEGHEGVFLATHTSISGFDISGSHSADIAEPNERAVLTALSNPQRRHAFCIIQGEPGSGKSHLIRWLSVNWPIETDVTLLLQRADGSLEGALRQLRERLPTEFKELFEKLGKRHRAAPSGRANIFLSNLANALDPTHFDPPLEDVDWCRTNLPHQLVLHSSVRGAWKGPARILNLLEGGSREGKNERFSASASFDLFDIEDLARCCVTMHGTGILPATEKLANRLLKEGEVIQQYREKGWTAEELNREMSASLRTSVQLMDALNRRRNDAIQYLLGVSAEGLKTLFRQIRERLALRNQRLILLLEDITSWEGIDDSLIDVLVVNADTRGGEGHRDLCPLISVVGVTPEYYGKLAGNYRGRITHEINLGKTSHGGALGDVATLREREGRIRFSARYLSAVRSGESLLNAWREKRRTNDEEEPPNKCINCPVHDECHKIFGAKEGIGLYPLTADALERMFDALNDNDKGLTWKTPRGILQAILTPTLSRPEALEEAEFPTILLETTALVPDSRRLSPRLAQIADVAVASEDAPRMRRMLAYWGDKSRANTTIENGVLTFAGVPRGVFDAFELPWIGTQTPDSNPVPEPQRESEDLPPPKPTARPPRSGQPTPKPTGPIPEPPSIRGARKKPELERLQNQIRKWFEGGELESSTDWNKTLYEFVKKIEPREVGLDPYTFRRLLTNERVKIEGTGPNERNYFFINREQWALNGFEAIIALRLEKSASPQDKEFHYQNLGVMMRQLEIRLSDYADRRLTRISGSGRWSPVPAVIQILLARAWLRGATTPDAPLSVQLRTLLSDEPDENTVPAIRCEAWVDFLKRTNSWHEQFREGLREMLGTPQGEARNFGLADVSSAALAIIRFRTSLKFDQTPAKGVEVGVEEFDKAREIIAATEGSLSKILRAEHARVNERAKFLRKSLLKRSIRAHFKRVDDAVNLVSDSLTNAAPARVSEWKTEYTRLMPRLEVGTAVEDLLTALSDPDGLPSRAPEQLGWLALAPIRDLEEFCDLSGIADQTIAELLKPVRDCVEEAHSMGSLDEIRKIGRNLRNAATSA